MDLSVVLSCALGVVLLTLGAINEFQWRRRLWNHVSLTGRVVELYTDHGDSCYPEIEYEFQGQQKKFRSSFSMIATPAIGEKVRVVTDQYGDNAEYFTNQTRWYFTAIPIVAGLVALAIAFF